MASKYLIQIEALNINNYVYDTDDISTIRGGSMLLKDAIDEVKKKMCIDDPVLKPVSTGASIGIFSTVNELNAETDAEDIIVTALGICRDVSHDTTFGAACVKRNGDFKKELDSLQIEIRKKQYRHTTYNLPEEVEESRQHCSLDGVRPAVKEVKNKGFLSYLTDYRREKGISLKKKELNEIIQHSSEVNFTWELNELAAHPDGTSNTLNNKICYIHFDGNAFGMIKDKYCITDDKMGEYDQKIQDHQKDILANYIITRLKHDDFSFGGKAHIEVLLWGGDECDIILPAWKGFDFLEFFMDKNRNINKLNVPDMGAIPLTYGMGAVFCHRTSPLLQIRKLAQDLADKVKGKVKNNDKPPLSTESGDAVHYLVLETNDMITSSLDKFTDTYYPSGVFDGLMITSGEVEDIVDTIGAYKKAFPRNKLYDIIKTIFANDLKKAEKTYDSACKRSQSKNLLTWKDFSELNHRKLFLVTDLWDYVQIDREAENE